MKSKVLWLVITGIILFSVVFMSCTSETTSTSTTSTTTQTSVATTSVTTTANWWDKIGEPKYGGTITVVNPNILTISFDNYSLVGSGDQWWLEGLFSNNVWTLDRSEFNYQSGFIPTEYRQGILIESWEQKDTTTMVWHIRQGVYWQDKAPVNGREFTANDVVAHYNRVLGMGDGYTTKSPTYVSFTTNWESVIAVDEYTVELTFSEPVGVLGLMGCMETMSLNTIEAPEWVALKKTATGNENPLEDWHNAVGTGAWMLTDYVSNSSITYSKNPNYWGYDERYPENQLPYADTIKKLLIQDSSTKLAAMRTGKIDTYDITSVEYQSLSESNPEMVFTKGVITMTGAVFRVDKEPFTDVRVRAAMQMALDTEAIAKSVNEEYLPCGLLSQAMTGFCWAYADWPQSVKDEYHYNVTEAKALLSEAGYADGFSTKIQIGPSANVSMVQIMKAYFAEVGIDMEIEVMDDATLRQYTTGGKHEQMVMGQGGQNASIANVLARVDANNPSLNYSRLNNAEVQELLGQMYNVTTTAELQEIIQQIDQYTVEQHLNIVMTAAPNWTATQSWLKGGSGVESTAYYMGGWLYSRCWVDKD